MLHARKKMDFNRREYFFISKTLPKISVPVLLTALRVKGVAARTAEKMIANVSC